MKKASVAFIFILLGTLIPGMTVHAVGEDGQQEASTAVSSDPVDHIGYSGPVDMVTGAPATDGAESTDEYINISENVRFNRISKEYVFSVGTSSIRSSVSDGMVVTDSVTLAKEGEMNLSVYKDGAAMTDVPSPIKEPGNYVVVTYDNNSEKQLLSFQIVNEITGKLTYLVLPNGFSITSLSVDDQLQSHSTGTVDMTKEGHYVVNYTSSQTGESYKLDVKIDHTPPQVTFEGLDAENNARGPVTVTGMEEGDTISIVMDDTENVTLDDDNQVSETGSYHVVVTDRAGNSIEQDFRILLYLNLNATLFIVAISLAVLGVVIALIITRKKIRVR